ncbi:hypothetical protein [Staphylococcus equorum]|uniref:hypothetical protein n=1 Tax=Staphylococcus equorum TaxID=246432 RepID=UPI0008539DE5|nr:hypothetical protein [Staphylococcus equorum]OEL08244.1 hypothetical protein AST04_08650 [Staphylococcus equorum]
MPNNQTNNDVYEEAKQLRRNVVTAILVVGVIIAAVFAYNQYSKAKENQERLDNRMAEIEMIDAENKKVEKANVKLQKEVGTYDTLQATKDFYNHFFNWSSWSEYRDNMKQLQLTYPNIDDDKIVDISGDTIGASVSPTSSYERETFVGENKGQTGEFVTQSKVYDDGNKSSAIWYIVSDYKDGKLDIESMKAYRE